MKKTTQMAYGALIAALYVVLTFVANILGLANGAIQVRFSEALTILPAFTPAAIPGLAVGCALSNILTGCALWDVVFGTLATLIGAVLTRIIGKSNKFLAVIPPILANTLIIPFVLRFTYGVPEAMPYLFLTVCLGELISAGILGCFLYKILESKRDLFK